MLLECKAHSILASKGLKMHQEWNIHYMDTSALLPPPHPTFMYLFLIGPLICCSHKHLLSDWILKSV